ncbi:GAF and ANTAR domain-containing protein [Actinacidiphila sp. ITFR-21]|uniref:GAF and ANTAR domain-containing protein n=1 Tax=Actinacidiphila sp. ITFR-21 TaxID=3075199 RepID=UPI00288C1A98|nr:GAF and ANTAR domain-containing protein [Streptomyces sp. ITFR-21]WNI14289.1 GAF and ANTAR domain-containing protein [Streptomyces sp. ITFR-21]
MKSPSDAAGAAADRTLFNRALAEAIAAPDVRSVPARLCQACVDLLDVTGASVSLSGGPGLRTLWWSSDPVAAELAEVQYTLGDGPCQSALGLVAPVLAGDLAQGVDARRWPLFAQRAVELGVRAVFSLPLGSAAVATGTLDLYRREQGPLSARDKAFAFPAADAITFALIRIHSDAAAQAGSDEEELASWLEGAESDHEEVHYATGMLMVQLGVDPHHALARLRAYAFAQGRTVTEVARDVIALKLSFDE